MGNKFHPLVYYALCAKIFALEAMISLTPLIGWTSHDRRILVHFMDLFWLHRTTKQHWFQDNDTHSDCIEQRNSNTRFMDNDTNKTKNSAFDIAILKATFNRMSFIPSAWQTSDYISMPPRPGVEPGFMALKVSETRASWSSVTKCRPYRPDNNIKGNH